MIEGVGFAGYVLVGDDGELSGPVAKNLAEAELAGLAAHVGAAPGDCVFFAAGIPRCTPERPVKPGPCKLVR